MARRTATLIIPAGLDRHPVVIKLARITQLDIDCVIGKVVKIIEWCAQHSTDGIVDGAQLEDFEAVARCDLGNAFGTLLERKSVPMRADKGTQEQVQLMVFLECFGKPAKNKALSARRKKRHAVCIAGAGARTRGGQASGHKDKRQIQASRQTEPVSDPAAVAIGETQRRPQRSGQELVPTPDRSPVRPKEIQDHKGQQPAAAEGRGGVPAERVEHWVGVLAKNAGMPIPAAREVLSLEHVTEDLLRWGFNRTRERMRAGTKGNQVPLKCPWKYLDKLLREGKGPPGTFGPVGGGAEREFIEERKASVLETLRRERHTAAVAAAGGIG